MSDYILLLEDPDSWHPPQVPGLPLVAARDYLTDPLWAGRKGLKVLNLCRDRDYLDVGYYCSLLAEARGHRILPGVRTINDLADSESYPVDLEELNRRVSRLIRRRQSQLASNRLDFVLVFGEAPLVDLKPLGRALYGLFQAPLLQVVLERQTLWRVSSVRIVAPTELDEVDDRRFAEALPGHLALRWRKPRARRQARYDMAILHNPDEAMPPSNRKALAHFIRAAREKGMEAELITSREFDRIPEFDALFIRETTAVNDHTYRFARKAQREGLVVMDDPDSILRCGNKIYLAERLAANHLPAPKTLVAHKHAIDGLPEKLGFPMVLKVPDGSFSRGVIKVKDLDELKRGVRQLFRDTELVLAQSFVPTQFDWRVGLVAGEALYVCQYGMAPGHWQIINHAARHKRASTGDHVTLAVEDAPAEVISLAQRAARMMGDGLYGVDIKQTAQGLKVIEVNDNPNIDAGVEDMVLGHALYRRIMAEFVRRLEQRGR
ncbi:MAG: RimK family protein [Chromatiaceae bacterium]|jgi:glutathione synthase/RimK-type ligase-like ATP-grasp enzyme